MVEVSTDNSEPTHLITRGDFMDKYHSHSQYITDEYWNKYVVSKVRVEASSTEPNLQLMEEALSVKKPYKTADFMGKALKQPASKESLEQLEKRVNTLEGGVVEPGIIDVLESNDVDIRGYRGYQGDYLEINGVIALKRKDGTWAKTQPTDNYWPDGMYKKLPANFVWKLYKEALKEGILVGQIL